MTPRELSGWVPAERQIHLDADENVVGYTVIEREPRIDDTDRAELLALAEYEAAVCQCGYHPILADDEANTFKAETHVCPVCAGQAVWNRILSAEDEKTVQRDAPPAQPRPADGRHPYMRLLTPEQAKAARPSPEQ